jgi:tellurite resistance protein
VHADHPVTSLTCITIYGIIQVSSLCGCLSSYQAKTERKKHPSIIKAIVNLKKIDSNCSVENQAKNGCSFHTNSAMGGRSSIISMSIGGIMDAAEKSVSHP